MHNGAKVAGGHGRAGELLLSAGAHLTRTAAPPGAAERARGRPGADTLDEARCHAVLRQAAAVLLAHPDPAFYRRLPLVYRALLELPPSPARRGLTGFCDHAAAEPEARLAAHYTRVFDPRGRRALQLTVHTFGGHGDVRRRGHALARIQRVLADHGWSVAGPEPHDHLAVLLEFAARGDAAAGEVLLNRFRSGVEPLRARLHQDRSAYAPVLDAVCATLPPAAEPRAEGGLPAAPEPAPVTRIGAPAAPRPPAGEAPRVPPPRAAEPRTSHRRA
ncbi:nitrate reductase molybdenum cofactor assembly chaperone [Streptomonospora nanhaiensis]|uniref:nitrate reductase molybdenum cofactor assembly chaperone n=3 Tax=Streptomonospora nanhaiensis TaxID=1323731 RepID=UPI00360C7BB3